MIEKNTLSNGLRIVGERMPQMHSVSIGVWVATGSGYENRINNGVSHFIEHMMFKGTKTKSVAQVASSIEDIGGQLNAFTSRDCTCYYVKILDSHIHIGLELLSDIIQNSLIKEDDVNLERKVILEEISMYEDTPEELVQDMASEHVWKGNSMGYPILGTPKSLSGINREVITDYMANHYTPSNSVIAISGNYPENVSELINLYFGNWAVGAQIVRNRVGAKYKKFEQKIVKETEQSHLCILYPGLSNGNKLIHSLIAMNNILGGTMSSRLFQKNREEKGLVYSIYSYITSYNKEGLVSIYAGMNAANIDQVKELIFEEILQLRKTGLTDYELYIAKEQLKSSLVFAMDSPASTMSSIGKSEIIMGRVLTTEEVLIKINAITHDTVNEAIRLVFDENMASTITLGK